MTEITWGSLSLAQLQALQAVEDNKDVDKSVWQGLQSMGLVAFDEGSDADYLTPLGRRIYDEARAARPNIMKTVKLRVPSADGLYYETLYTDGTWEGEEVHGEQ